MGFLIDNTHRYEAIIRRFFIYFNAVILVAGVIFHIHDAMIGRGTEDFIMDYLVIGFSLVSMALVKSPLSDHIAYRFSVFSLSTTLCLAAVVGAGEGQLLNYLFLIPFFSWFLLGRWEGIIVSVLIPLTILFIYINPLHLDVYAYSSNSLFDSLVIFVIASFLNAGVHLGRDMMMDDMEQSLGEKELLIREVYHRTKNNLAGIVNIMKMQLADESDERLLDFGHETLSRINSLTLMNEKLHQSHSLVQIDLGEFLHSLAEETVKNLNPHGDKIDLHLDFDAITADSSLALNCAVIMHEALTNSLKYAYEDNTGGILSCSLKTSVEGSVVLSVCDDGRSPRRQDLEPGSSTGSGLGTRLIRGIGRQLPGGRVDLALSEGTCWHVSFNAPAAAEPLHT